MAYDACFHHRRSLRLHQYDYSSPGYYYVTICAHDKRPLFGRVFDGQMRRDDCGEIAHREWLRSAELRSDIALDAFIVMPNHIHGIILIRGGTARHAPTVEQFGKPVRDSLATLVRAYKSAVTRGVNEFRSTPGAPVWQRNYYEHVIRDEEELNRIREYILTNPLRWDFDRYNADSACGPQIGQDFDW
jgi:REP element-mobilizing transposase RayT